MKLHSVFLRNDCILLDRFELSLRPVGEMWSVVGEIHALVFDTMIRRADWHFMWLQDACSRRGIGLTKEAAIRRAVSLAFDGVSKRFNAAELDSLQIAEYPGFQIAEARILTLQIQRKPSLKSADVQHPLAAPAR